WPEDAAAGAVRPDPETTRWCLSLYVVPLPKPTGTAITLSPFRRPTRDSAPVEAKAGCLYPNNARALTEARSRGFDNCLMCDMLGNVAELGTANIFMAKDGVVFTPAANGTFLSGITRARVIALLREAGVTVVETALRYPDFQSADEIFSPGTFTKVSPVIRIDDRDLQPGPFYRRARELYWEFAHAGAGGLRIGAADGEKSRDRTAANVIDSRVDHAFAHDVEEDRRVELGAVELAECHGEVGTLRIPDRRILRAQGDHRRGMRPADRDRPGRAARFLV